MKTMLHLFKEGYEIIVEVKFLCEVNQLTNYIDCRLTLDAVYFTIQNGRLPYTGSSGRPFKK
ncbi:hypothetical protein YSY43_12290 [Paenibacillus sp. YSY-4.3]